MHLIVDGYCSNKEVLTRASSLEDFIVRLVEKGKMALIGRVRVQDYPHPSIPGSKVYSGVAFLGESSVTVHCYPEYSYIFIDVFHCVSFEFDYLLEWIKKELGLDAPQALVLGRGVDSLGVPIAVRHLSSLELVKI